jgi:mannan endo-1,4-beta-mannosidase
LRPCRVGYMELRRRRIIDKLIISLFLIALSWPLATGRPTASATGPFSKNLEPANPNASQNARKVLNYLAALPGQRRGHLISGQHLSGARNAAFGYREFVTPLFQATGEWVALVGADYGNGRTSADIAADNQVLIDHWNAGGLVTISFHANNPWTGGDSWDLTGRDLVELVTPGTAANRVWMAELDKVAAGLAELRDAGVVVLWRPFHEMTFTKTFWWDSGAHPGHPEPFIDLWQHMFDYFTHVKGLDNLLWVYSVANNENENPVLAAMYPGQAYVDMVGVDVYDDSVEIRGDGYDRLVALGKPFALTEFGPRNKRDGSYDNLTTVKTIQDRYPATTYVLQWSSWPQNKVAIVDNRNASAFMKSRWIITRGELDWQSGPRGITLIVDDSDPRFLTKYIQDPWRGYTEFGGQHFGSTHYYNQKTGTGQDLATWSFTVPEPGSYDVYAWWWAGGWRPAGVPYTIYDDRGVSTVRVDQKSHGGRWNLLGTFHFQDEGAVVVSDDVESGRDLVADAIRLVRHSENPSRTSNPSTVDMILDDLDARFSMHYAQDSWQEHIEYGGQSYGGTYRSNQRGGTGQDLAAWSFAIPKPGTYAVYAWWPEGESRPSDVPYTIHHQRGATTVRVNQSRDSGQWHLLGTFYLRQHASVVVSDDISSGEDIVADAIRVVYLRE